MLPRRLISCYRSKFLYTPDMLQNDYRLRTLHPKWEHLFFNHYEARDWVKANTPEWHQLYEFYSMDRQREEVFRWLGLWKLGGIWTHPQFRPLRPFDAILHHPIFLGMQTSSVACEATMIESEVIGGAPNAGRKLVSALCIGSEPEHWFVGKILDALIERAGYLDSGEPTAEEAYYTTGDGVLQTVLQSCVSDCLSTADFMIFESPPAAQTIPSLQPGNTLEVFGYLHEET